MGNKGSPISQRSEGGEGDSSIQDVEGEKAYRAGAVYIKSLFYISLCELFELFVL